MGQELTARMHYRALVKKRFFPVRIEGPTPALGSFIQFDGGDAGEMRTSRDDRGLALLNIEKATTAITEKRDLSCGQSHLYPYQPDWMRS